MDVNSLNKNYEYLNKSSNMAQYSDYINNSEKIDKQNVVKKISKDENIRDQKKEKDEENKKELDSAIRKLNKFLEDEKTHAEYEKHEDLGTMMVRIVEDDTNKIIVELPPKKVLDMVASICKQVGVIDKKA